MYILNGSDVLQILETSRLLLGSSGALKILETVGILDSSGVLEILETLGILNSLGVLKILAILGILNSSCFKNFSNFRYLR